MFDLVLYYYPTCPYCRKVTRFIDKHDLEEIELKN
ncbi:MAG: Glutaredoxin, partial [Halanaerobium sp.]